MFDLGTAGPALPLPSETKGVRGERAPGATREAAAGLSSSRVCSASGRCWGSGRRRLGAAVRVTAAFSPRRGNEFGEKQMLGERRGGLLTPAEGSSARAQPSLGELS